MSSDYPLDDAAATELWREVNWLRGLALRHGLAGGDADDAVQETLLTVANSGDAARGRGWLRRVLERRIGTGRRSDRRRRGRERAAAQPESDGSDPAAALEQLEFTRRLQGAVADLPRKDREVLALRFGAGLLPIEIAETLGTTPNAVSTRLSRALVKLRHSLEATESQGSRRLGGIAAAQAVGESQRHYAVSVPRAESLRDSPPESLTESLPGSLPWSLPEAAKITPALALLLMNKKLGVAALLVALLVGALAILSTGPSGTDRAPRIFGTQPDASLAPIGDDEGRSGSPIAGAPMAGEPPSPHRAPIATGESGHGIAAPEVPLLAAKAGSIAVEVREAIGGQPARGVGLRLFRLEPQMRWYAFEAKATDASGIASFEDVAPGRYLLYMERVTLKAAGDSERLEVAAGRETRVKFLVDESQYAKGIVLGDSGAPVPGASIWIGSGGGPVDHGVMATKSGPDGRFVAKYVDGLQYLSASAPGYAPSLSAARDVGQPTNADGEVILVLGRRRGTLRGVVLGPSREPRSGVRLMLGSSQEHVELEGAARGSYWTRPARYERSGNDGTFEFTDVHVGDVLLRARAPGTATWIDVVTVVDGATREVTVNLLQGGSVAGQITDELGAPVGAARVELVGPGSGGPMTRARTTVDEEGRFHLEHLLPGLIQLEARGMSGEGVQTQTIDVQDGQVHAWNPVLQPEGRFIGTLVSAEGEPLERWYIGTQLLEDGMPSGSGRGGWTDAAGQFSFIPGPSSHYEISVYPAGRFYGEHALRRSPLAPTGEAIELVVPLAKIPRGGLRGRFLRVTGDSATDPAATTPIVELVVESSPTTRLEQPLGEDGTFEFKHLPPGEFTLTLRSPSSPAHTVDGLEPLEAGEVRHLGDLTIGGPK